ncbi:TPA: hypothetical protein ACH3X1_013124 [Trebouxia sp. C0004]
MVTELFQSWLKLTSNDTPKILRSEPTADLSEASSLAYLLLLDAEPGGSDPSADAATIAAISRAAPTAAAAAATPSAATGSDVTTKDYYAFRGETVLCSDVAATAAAAAAAAVGAARAIAAIVAASADGSEPPGSAAGRAAELGESVMLNDRSKDSSSSTCYTLRLPAAPEVLVFTSLAELAHVFQVDSMASYAQPKYSNHPTFDALNCGIVCFQTGVMKVDLSPAFDRLRQELGEATAGLNDLEAMAIDTDVQE